MGPDDLSAAKSRQILLLLLLRAKGQNGMLDAPHLGIHGKDQPVIPTAIAEPLHDQHGRNNVGRASAVFLRSREPQDAHSGALFPILARELALTVTINQPRIQLLLGKVNHSLLVFELFVCQRKVHWVIKSPSERCQYALTFKHPSQKCLDLHRGQFMPIG